MRDRLFVVDPICGEAPGEAENKVRYLTASREDHRRHAAETSSEAAAKISNPSVLPVNRDKHHWWTSRMASREH